MKVSRILLILLILSTSALAADIDLQDPSNYNIRFDGALSNHYLGGAVATGDINGDGKADLVIGAKGAGYNSRANSGSVYIIYGGAALSGNIDLNSSSNYYARYDGAAALDELGNAVACADIDDDGKDDIIMSAFRTDFTFPDAGSVYVRLGKNVTTGNHDLSTATEYDVRFDGPAASATLGDSLGVGYIDNDDKADLLMGAPYDGTLTFLGEAYLIWGQTAASATGNVDLSNSSNYDARFQGVSPGDHLGSAFACGDVNGDARDDILIGAYMASGSGIVYLVSGEASLSGTIDMSSSSNYITRFDGAQSGDELGQGLSLALGDFNGDTYADLVMGARNAQSGAGSVYLVWGAASYASSSYDLGTSESYAARFDGHGSTDLLGESAAVGDLDNDGYQDLILGAGQADQNVRTDSGSVYLIYGTAEAFTPKNRDLSNAAYYDFRLDGAHAGDQLGIAVTSGDINGDSRADAVMGAHYEDNNARTDNGATYVYAAVVQPSIASISPTSGKQGWIGDITITGTNFQKIDDNIKSRASFDDANILVYNTYYDSSTQLRVRVNIKPTTVTEAKNLTITNPDGQSTTRTGIFSVEAATPGAGPSFESIVFTYGTDEYDYPGMVDPVDGRLLLPAHIGLNIEGRIRDAVALPPSREAVNFRILSTDGVSLLYFNLAQFLSNLTNKTVDFEFDDFNIIPGTNQIILYAENANGDPTQYPVLLKFAAQEDIEEIIIGDEVDKWIVQIYVTRDIEVDFVLTGLNPHPRVWKNVKLYCPKSLRALGIGSAQARAAGVNQITIEKEGVYQVYTLLITGSGVIAKQKLYDAGSYSPH